MTLSKRALHFTIVVGSGAIAIATAFGRGGTSPAAIVTTLLVVELCIRFRYVIGLLDWQVSPSRLALLTGFWVGLIGFAWVVNDPAQWGMVATMLFAIGVAIEVHNLVTRQWVIGDERFQRSLRNDILRGIASASFAVITTPIVTVRWPGWIVLYVGGLMAADVARFLEMVLRHRRLRAT